MCKITFEHWACQTNLAQCLIEKQFLLLNGWTVWLWLIIELEKYLLSGLFCKVYLKYNGKLKGLGEYDCKFVSQGKVIP